MPLKPELGAGLMGRLWPVCRLYLTYLSILYRPNVQYIHVAINQLCQDTAQIIVLPSQTYYF